MGVTVSLSDASSAHPHDSNSISEEERPQRLLHAEPYSQSFQALAWQVRTIHPLSSVAAPSSTALHRQSLLTPKQQCTRRIARGYTTRETWLQACSCTAPYKRCRRGSLFFLFWNTFSPSDPADTHDTLLAIIGCHCPSRPLQYPSLLIRISLPKGVRNMRDNQI